MPRSKTQISKLPRDLKEPIEFGRPSLLWGDAEFASWLNERNRFVLAEQLRKLEVLMKELKAPDDSAVRLTWLCLELAKKLYPGFLTTIEAKPKGRPRRINAADSHLFDDPASALAMVDVMRRDGVAKTDLDACFMLSKIRDEKLRGAELDRKARSLASIIATTRANVRRRRAGKIH
jgi:hypothetical protein